MGKDPAASEPEDKIKDARKVVFGDQVEGDKIMGDKLIFTRETSYDVAGLANPYLGLRAFTYSDRLAYAGRDLEIQEAINKLATSGVEQTLLFITGASGCGKSSFAQAGILPALEEYYRVRHKKIRRAVIRPSTDPMAMVTDALAQFKLDEPVLGIAEDLTPAEFFDYLTTNTAFDQVNLFVIDQLEESFNQANSGGHQWLCSFLKELPNFKQVRTHIIATLRSDYLKELFEIQELWERAKGGVELRPMAQVELKNAIQAPLIAAGRQDSQYKAKRFEPSLLERLVKDASQDAAYLPLLQVTLRELWYGGQLTPDRYGQLTDAIRQRAETVYRYADFNKPSPNQERSVEDQATILKILLDLVTVSVGSDSPRNARRRRWKEELEGTTPARKKLVAELVEARLLSVSAELRGNNQNESVDIIHESLLANWPRLGEAIEAQRGLLRRRAQFEGYLGEWLSDKRSDGYLLAGARLEEARRLSEQGDIVLNNKEAQEFLRRSYERAEAETRRQLVLERRARLQLQVLTFILSALLLISSAWIGYPYVLSLIARGELAPIPAGSVVIGPDNQYQPPRGKVNEFFLPAFQIERYEVTNHQYRLCVQARRCSEPKFPLNLNNPDKQNDPVTGVSAVQAYEYCQWIGRRLPSEIEWERAARGQNGRLWPWGQPGPDAQKANLDYGNEPSLMPVSKLPGGCSPEPERVCGLIGNAAEWTASWKPNDNHYHPEEAWKGTKTKEDYDRLLISRGFDYQNSWAPGDPPMTMVSQAFPVNESFMTMGFRCGK